MTVDSTTTFRISRIGQIHVPVQDLARATRFYRETLGMTFLFEVPRMAFFDCGGIRLMLGTPEDGSAAKPATIIYYRVDDIHEAFAALKARGARFIGEPHFVAKLASGDLWMTFLHDSEDNVLGIQSEVTG